MRRVTDPQEVYRVWSDARIHPHVIDDFSRAAPLPEIVSHAHVVCLMPDDGSAYFIFVPLRFVVYEAHGAVLPESRSRSVQMGQEALAWMRAHTMCRTVLSFVPRGNFPAMALDRALGFKRVGTVPRCNPVNGRLGDLVLFAKEM